MKNSLVEELENDNSWLKIQAECDRNQTIELERSLDARTCKNCLNPDRYLQFRNQELAQKLEHITNVLDERTQCLLMSQNQIVQLEQHLRFKEDYNNELLSRFGEKNLKAVKESASVNKNLYDNLSREIRNRDLKLVNLQKENDNLKLALLKANQELHSSNSVELPLTIDLELDFSAICDDNGIFNREQSPSTSELCLFSKYQNCPRMFEFVIDKPSHVPYANFPVYGGEGTAKFALDQLISSHIRTVQKN